MTRLFADDANDTTARGARRLDRLTQSTVDRLPAKAERYEVFDDLVPGLAVRVAPSGRKTFSLLYRPIAQRAKRRLQLGTADALTLKDARLRARRELARVADGADPAEDRRARRVAPTVGELVADYLDDAEGRLKPRTLVEYRRLFEKHVVPGLGARKVADVTPVHVRQLHRRLRETPYQANRVLAAVAAFFTFAEREGVRPRHSSPAVDVQPYPERSRERALDVDEFKRLGAALTRAEESGLPPAPSMRRKTPPPERAKHTPKNAGAPMRATPAAVAAIRLLMLTGCRESEVLSLRWDAVDVERGRLALADTKTGRANLPLSAAAAEIIASQPRIRGNPYVFPGRKPGTHLQEIKRLWTAVRHAAGLPDLRLHDLRHAYASLAVSGGESLYVVGSLLNHRNHSTTQKYAHLGDNPVRTAADRVAGKIASLIATAGSAAT